MRNREGGGRDVKIKIGEFVAEQMFRDRYDEHDLNDLEGMLDKYDWDGFKTPDTFRAKLLRIRKSLIDLKGEIISGKVKSVEESRVNAVIRRLEETFLNTMTKSPDLQMPIELFDDGAPLTSNTSPRKRN